MLRAEAAATALLRACYRPLTPGGAPLLSSAPAHAHSSDDAPRPVEVDARRFAASVEGALLLGDLEVVRDTLAHLAAAPLDASFESAERAGLLARALVRYANASGDWAFAAAAARPLEERLLPLDGREAATLGPEHEVVEDGLLALAEINLGRGDRIRSEAFSAKVEVLRSLGHDERARRRAVDEVGPSGLHIATATAQGMGARVAAAGRGAPSVTAPASFADPADAAQFLVLCDRLRREGPLSGGRPIARRDFPPGFLFGVGTAAYQNEGDNAGSDFWAWEEAKGFERSGKASNSWALWREDKALLQELGANAYRLSIEWGRVMPAPGVIDQAALEGYALRLMTLGMAGIRPVVTLHHFTHPAWFWERHPRGWEDPAAVETFVEYARLMAARLGHLVDDWLTFNEANVLLLNGYVTGMFPPGVRSAAGSLEDRLVPALANVARAHRRAYAAIREADVKVAAETAILRLPAERAPFTDAAPARVGIVLNWSLALPQDAESAEDRAAARAWDDFFHHAFLEAAEWGFLDADLDGAAETPLDATAGRAPASRTLDFLGVNYYTRFYVRRAPGVLPPLHCVPGYAEIRLDPVGAIAFDVAGATVGPLEKDDFGREVYPEGLRLVLKAAHARAGVPILVTENGLPDAKDRLRAPYIRAHLQALHEAVAIDRTPVIGYLHWTLVDNYEWGSFAPKTGLYRLDAGRGYARQRTRGSEEYRRFLSE